MVMLPYEFVRYYKRIYKYIPTLALSKSGYGLVAHSNFSAHFSEHPLYVYYTFCSMDSQYMSIKIIIEYYAFICKNIYDMYFYLRI